MARLAAETWLKINVLKKLNPLPQSLSDGSALPC
jgi:hypothetical protein